MNWKLRPLAEVADFVLGKMLDRAKNKGDLLPYLANVNVRWGEFDLSGLREMRFESHELERYGLRKGDILMCEGGEPGRCALWQGPLANMMFQKALHRIRPYDFVDSRFLYYQLLHIGKVNGFASYFTGSTIKHLPREQLARLPVRIPDLFTQKRIARILVVYDDLIATNQRRIALLEEAARRLYREWFVNLRFPGYEAVKLVDGVPEGWKSGTVFDFVSILSGGTPKTGVDCFWSGDIPFFTPKDAPDSLYVHETENTLTDTGLASCNSSLFPKNTTFVTARGTVGRLALAQRPMAINQSCYALAPKNGFDTLFLFFSMREAVERLKQAANGGVFNAIVVDTFKFIPFVLPTDGLSSQFGRLTSSYLSQIENLLLQNRVLAKARDALLPKLMSGQLDTSGSRLRELEAA